MHLTIKMILQQVVILVQHLVIMQQVVLQMMVQISTIEVEMEETFLLSLVVTHLNQIQTQNS